ncbi:hypothetical protein Ancab_033674 [Ancistrocladus abbreviatus]
MDIDFCWGGDLSIVLGVEAARVASMPIQDLQVFIVIRAIFQLAEEIPYISAIVVALLSEPKPRIDYTLKAASGSLTTIPGLADMTYVSYSLMSFAFGKPSGSSFTYEHLDNLGRCGTAFWHPRCKRSQNFTLSLLIVFGGSYRTWSTLNDLKNMEMIGKCDPYVVLHVRALFKVRTKVVDDNLNPVWNETFELIAEDKETQSLIIELKFYCDLSGSIRGDQVFDEDIGQDKKLGITKLPLVDLEEEEEKVLYHAFNREEQHAMLEAEKRILEERKYLEDAEVIESTVEAIGGATSAVGSSVGMVGCCIGVGLGAMGSDLSKAGKFMGRTITGHLGGSKRGGSLMPVNSVQENGDMKPLQ